MVDVQAQALALWQAQLGLLGDTLAARQAAAADVLALAEVVEAGVSPDDLTLWYVLDSGVRGEATTSAPAFAGSVTVTSEATKASWADETSATSTTALQSAFFSALAKPVTTFWNALGTFLPRASGFGFWSEAP